MAATWVTLEEAPLTREALAALLENRIPAIRMRGFADSVECAAFARAARAGPIKYYSVTPPVGYIGMAQYEYRWDRPRADYFHDVAAANHNLAQVVYASFDPVARLIERIAAVYDAPVGCGREPGFGAYYVGIIRIASQGISLHADYAPLNSPAYSIGGIDAQLAWNFFAEDLGQGGATTLYNAPWSPVARQGEIPQSYNLPPEVVAGAPTFTYAATAGDAVIFNSRNPHQIAGGPPQPGRERISIGSFIGRMPDGALAMWT